MTLAQVQAIYECVYTNWDQITVNGITGTNSPIALFWPQSGSGTRAVYTDVLGFDPTKPGTAPSTLHHHHPADHQLRLQQLGAAGAAERGEHRGRHHLPEQPRLAATRRGGTPSRPVHVAAAAIYIYSAGKFSSEWNDPADYNSAEQRTASSTYCSSNLDDADLNGANTMGNFLAGTLSMASMRSTGGTGEAYVDLTGQAGRFNQDTNRGTDGIDGTTVSEANEWYHNLPRTRAATRRTPAAAIPGVRYVYNIADTVLPGYNGAKMLIGFDNQARGTKSVLCNGDDASTITAQGFLPLTSGSGAPSGSDAERLLLPGVPGLGFPGKGGTLSWATPDLRRQKRLSVS